MISVYVSVRRGTVAVFWYLPVSHVTAPVGAALWFMAMVYVWLFALQDTMTSMALGVTESEV